MANHDRIWLSARCETCAGEERTWCWDNVWAEGCDPPDCTVMPTEYVRADLAVSHAEVDALRAKVMEAAWQPIASAPRDGTVIDLWFAGDWNQRMCNYAWRVNCWVSDRSSAFNDNPRIITHWRPLPAGPVASKETPDAG